MSEDLIVLKIFKNEVEAAMAQQLIQEAGLKVIAIKDDAGGMEPQLQFSGGVKLIVTRCDAARARRVLSISE